MLWYIDSDLTGPYGMNVANGMDDIALISGSIFCFVHVSWVWIQTK